MLNSAAKKSAIASVVEKFTGTGAGKGSKDKEDTVAGSDAFAMAADALFDAMKKGDRKAFARSLKSAIAACEDDEGEEEMDEELDDDEDDDDDYDDEDDDDDEGY